MRLRKKIIIIIIFSLGIFSLFTTVYKTAVELPKLKYEQVDGTRVIAQVILWTNIEASVVIIAGSIPTWGWISPIEKFSKVVTWIKLHSLNTSRTSERLPSLEAGGERETVQEVVGPMELQNTTNNIPQDGKGGSDTTHLQSIDRIERIACS